MVLAIELLPRAPRDVSLTCEAQLVSGEAARRDARRVVRCKMVTQCEPRSRVVLGDPCRLLRGTPRSPRRSGRRRKKRRGWQSQVTKLRTRGWSRGGAACEGRRV